MTERESERQKEGKEGGIEVHTSVVLLKSRLAGWTVPCSQLQSLARASTLQKPSHPTTTTTQRHSVPQQSPILHSTGEGLEAGTRLLAPSACVLGEPCPEVRVTLALHPPSLLQAPSQHPTAQNNTTQHSARPCSESCFHVGQPRYCLC